MRMATESFMQIMQNVRHSWLAIRLHANCCIAVWKLPWTGSWFLVSATVMTQKIGKRVALLDFTELNAPVTSASPHKEPIMQGYNMSFFSAWTSSWRSRWFLYTMTLHWDDMLGRASVTRITMKALWQLDMSLLFKTGVNNHIHINVQYNILWPNVNSIFIKRLCNWVI